MRRSLITNEMIRKMCQAHMGYRGIVGSKIAFIPHIDGQADTVKLTDNIYIVEFDVSLDDREYSLDDFDERILTPAMCAFDARRKTETLKQ